MPTMFLQPWFYVALGLAAVAGFSGGTYLGALRLENFELAVARAGDAQNAVTAFLRQRQQDINKEINDAHVIRLGNLGNELERLRKRPRSSVVPPVPETTSGSPGAQPHHAVICFARDGLREGLDGLLLRYGERVAALAAEGAGAIAELETCAAWAMKQYHLNPSKEQP